MKVPVLNSRRLPDVIAAAAAAHVSGGRDLWTDPLLSPPSDQTEATWKVLGEVLDPEIPISVVELGLVYGVACSVGIAEIELTFTATACPCMDFIREDIRDRLMQESWIDEVEIHEVWSPPWTNDRITDEGREKLRRLGVGVG
jgi:metal-sulfur cluster biosynthetic enzyme